LLIDSLFTPDFRMLTSAFLRRVLIRVPAAVHVLNTQRRPLTRKPFSLEPFSLDPFSLEPFSLEPFSLEPFSLEPFSLEPLLARAVAASGSD